MKHYSEICCAIKAGMVDVVMTFILAFIVVIDDSRWSGLLRERYVAHALALIINVTIFQTFFRSRSLTI